MRESVFERERERERVCVCVRTEEDFQLLFLEEANRLYELSG